jgi:molybdopterin-containing oxidoreductase family iron-sulfur binding subunit
MAKTSRRAFLQSVAGGSVATAVGFTEKTADKLIPYVVPPEPYVPGTWTVYATTCRECPAGCGMHVRHRDGRATKAEGNPNHPINAGGLCPRGQSALQGLYDPDRLRQPLHRKTRGAKPEPVSWDAAIAEIGRPLAKAGAKAALLSDLQTGALAQVMVRFAAALGAGRPLFYEPFSYEPLRAAHQALFGQAAVPDYHIESCDYVLSFGADFLESWVSPVLYARRFAEMHTHADGRMGRLAYVGPRLSMTAASADDSVPVPPSALPAVAAAVLTTMIEKGWARGDVDALKPLARSLAESSPLPAGAAAQVIEKLASRFGQRAASVALAGPVGASGPAAYRTALAAALLNYAAGRIGKTLDFSRPHALSAAAGADEVRKLLAALTPEHAVIVHNANLAYAMPVAAEPIRRAGMVVFLGTMMDETAALADWILPVDSPLESWGDYEPMTGVHGLMQPTMRRLWDTRPAGDILLALAAAVGKPLSLAAVEGEEPAREKDAAGTPSGSSSVPAGDFKTWLLARWEEIRKRVAPTRPFEDFWRDALRAGGVWEEPAAMPTPKLGGLPAPAGGMPTACPPDGGPPLRGHVSSAGEEHARGTEAAGIPPGDSSTPPGDSGTSTAALWTWSSTLLFDGRVANRSWLQETPDPVTSITWGSWVDVHPKQAKQLGLAPADLVELSTAAGKVEAPVRLTEDVAEGVVAIPFGQGHTALGRNAAGRGANAFALLGGPSGEDADTVKIRRTGRRHEPAYAAAQQAQYGRDLLQWVPLAALKRMKPGEGDNLRLPLPEGYDPVRDIYAPHVYKEHRWAMVIDLARCIGCGACTVACYAENNIALAGEEGVRRGHHLPWLQMVPYRRDADPRRLGFLPVLCQHCDAAPCEPVCPVFAAVHSDEGLNAQVYNRCIGTRYCMNNCPYKVRRFNWGNPEWARPLELQLNPDVTVRSRGVMEKCTFCIQRIRDAQHRAKREGRPVRDGEIQPACAQTCPTRVFTFGDLVDPASRVAALVRRDPRRYQVLAGLNTKPAVIYLRRILATGEA